MVIPTTGIDPKRTKEAADKFRVPFNLASIPITNRFVGRSADLNQLWVVLQPNVSNSRRVLVLHGTAGVGKTQLAIHFARLHKGDFAAIFWINGQDENTLIRSLADITTRLQDKSENVIASPVTENEEELRRAAQQALNWLSQENNSNWLLIYDNVDQYLPYNNEYKERGGYDIQNYFPSADHGSIIITTRLQRLIEVGTSSYLLSPLSISEGLDLLRTCSDYGTQCYIPTGADGDIQELASRLDGLPLAIVLAGSFIGRTGISFRRYLYLYNREWPSLQAAAEPQREYSHGSMLTAWTLSYHEIKNISPLASKLLYLLSFFHNNEIWFELIQKGNRTENLPGWFSELVSNEILFLKTIGILLDFSLVQQQRRLDTTIYSIHPVVQDWCQYALPKIDLNLERTTRTNCIISVVAAAHSILSAPRKNYWIQQQRIMPHVSYVMSKLDVSSYDHKQVSLVDSFHLIGNLYWDQGRVQEAEMMYQRAVVGKERLLGLNDPSTLETINCLGVVYTHQDKLQEAEKMLQRALIGYKKALGPDHVSALKVTTNLGLLYGKQGKLQEAEKMHLETLTEKEKILGPDDISTLDTVGNLGNVYLDQRKMSEAEQAYQRALRGYEKALGPDHTSTLLAINNLGGVYRSQGELKKAEKMYQRALSGYEKTLGANHTFTFMVANNLGNVYSDQGKMSEAERAYQRALRGYEKALGPDHTSTKLSVKNLRSLYRNQGQPNEAEEICQETLMVYEKEKEHVPETSEIGRYMLRSRNLDNKPHPQRIAQFPPSIIPSKSSRDSSRKGKKESERKQKQKTKERRDVLNTSSSSTQKQRKVKQALPYEMVPILCRLSHFVLAAVTKCAHFVTGPLLEARDTRYLGY
ncbi:hypothetical protein ZTR_08029 [Talaromyces verruculosus]|nr:hypothetical protein ZTR_08029 [Talaromyces verruculosus]